VFRNFRIGSDTAAIGKMRKSFSTRGPDISASALTFVLCFLAAMSFVIAANMRIYSMSEEENRRFPRKQRSTCLGLERIGRCTKFSACMQKCTPRVPNVGRCGLWSCLEPCSYLGASSPHGSCRADQTEIPSLYLSLLYGGRFGSLSEPGHR